jgi:DNA modification methylase
VGSEMCIRDRFEHFPKQTIRNRYEIKSANGRTRLTIPVIKPSGSKTNTKDILISDKENWQQVHWRSLIGAYSAAPYFEHYKSDIEQLIFSKEKYLVDFNLKIIEFFSDTWDLQISPELTTEYHHLYENDFRNNEFDKSELENNSSYIQVLFKKSNNFVTNLSLIDLLFCEGPIGRKILIK